MPKELTRRLIHPEIRVIDAKQGLVEYVASDETIDSYREIVKADGWRFNMFRKNAPFVDSHNYGTIENLLGKVVDFKVDGAKKQLVETVQWAIDVPEQELAIIGWKMTLGGYLKAVSVGFWPTKAVSRWDTDQQPFLQTCNEMGVKPENGVRTIYLEQEQVELSACIIGANPNALAKAYKAEVLTDADLQRLSMEYAKRETASAATVPEQAADATARARKWFLGALEQNIKSL